MESKKQGSSAFARLAPFLPSAWCAALAALPPDTAARVQEIRLRAERPVTLSLPEGERFLLPGGVTALRQRRGVNVQIGRQEPDFAAIFRIRCQHIKIVVVVFPRAIKNNFH